MSVPTNKKIAAEIAPHISSTSRDLQMGDIFCCFSSLIQRCTAASWHGHYYNFIVLRVPTMGERVFVFPKKRRGKNVSKSFPPLP